MIKKIICFILLMSAVSACRPPNQENISEENSSNEENILYETVSILYETDSIYPDQNNIKQPGKDCYSEKIKLCIDRINDTYRDTILFFRNYIKENDLRRIVCNNWIRDKDLDDLICESRYVAKWLETLSDLNSFSFLLYSTGNQGNTIVKWFWCNRESKEAHEQTRFLVANKRIIGINIIPGLGEGFAPIEEFENPQWIHTPPQMLNK